jgi:hypothetical protein
MKCEYCSAELSSTQSLKIHQKSAKYCIKKQKQLGLGVKIEYLICDCNKKFTVNRNYKEHIYKCKIKTKKNIDIISLQNNLEDKDKIIKAKNDEIVSLKTQLDICKAELKVYKSLSEKSRECIENIAKQPKTTKINTTKINNNNNLNLMTPLDMSSETFSQKIKDHFTEDYFMEGQRGVARFAVDRLLKDDDGKLQYVCTDPSRHIYKFKTKDGDVDRDVKAQKLTKVIWSDLVKKSHDITSDGMKDKEDDNGDVFLLYTGKYMDIKDMDTDNEKFRSTLASLTV